MLKADGVSVRYGDRLALDAVSLEVGAGERVVLLGPNGSGKSTLLSLFNGLVRPAAGRVFVGGEDVARLSPAALARRVATVPQSESPTFPFTVRQVAAMGRLPHSQGLWESPEDERMVQNALAAADALDLAERPVTELSGGERQRALLARLLAQDAPVALLDEPTTGLDVAHQLHFTRLLREGLPDRTVVAAIHDLPLAARFAERAVVLRGGKVWLDGPIETVLRDERLDEAFGVRFARWSSEAGLWLQAG